MFQITFCLKVKTLSINPYIVNWIINLLTNRQQRVIVDSIVTIYLHPVNNYYANTNICDISKSIETMTMRLQQHRIYRILRIFSNFGVN